MLFGTRKGAYTQAENTPGYFQAAHGGTLFLDEIADLPMDVQPTFLRSLENRTVQPLGATAPIPVEIGVVAASHGHLRALVAERKFRDDLYFRLADTTIHLPPLRARKVDIARLVVRAIARTDHKLVAHPKLIEACCVRPWPGNVRELLGKVGNAATTALVVGRDIVKLEDLEATAGMYIVAAEHETAQDKPRALRGLGELTKPEVVAALDANANNRSKAARQLRVHRTTINRAIERFGIKTAGNDGGDDDDGDDN
jgi:transcriptional regulator with PAS, ATPase and Fis domain